MAALPAVHPTQKVLDIQLESSPHFSEWHDKCYAKVKYLLHNLQFTIEAVTAWNESKRS